MHLRISLGVTGPTRSVDFCAESTIINSMSGVDDSGSQQLLQEVLSQPLHSLGFLIGHH